METTVVIVLGGVGLFLIGMIALTQGLRALAGSSLRRLLARFTTTPTAGAAAGALTTAIVQSSSATTVTAVGFVGAGLLTFPQALGIVFGANIGTTITGWLVAIVGFKLELSVVAQPLVFVGAVMRLFGSGRMRDLGWALAGFGLLFVGIDTMKAGMAGLEGSVTPSSFPDDTILGRLQLVLIGVAITLVTQSSSAGVATALVALAAGTISFPQAAAMVIGMDVGTTFTAALATVGGSTATRQTGFAHVIYNVMTGIMAFLLLDPFEALMSAWGSGFGPVDDQIALVAFHTTFNTLGALLVLPFAQPFARLIVWLVPERGPTLLQRLDERVLGDTESAVDAAFATVRDMATISAGTAADLMTTGGQARFDVGRLRTMNEALEATRAFIERIHTEPDGSDAHHRHVASMHVLDHLIRLAHRFGQDDRIAALQMDARLRRLTRVLRDTILAAAEDDAAAAEARLGRVRSMLRAQRHSYRLRTLEAASAVDFSAELALEKLDALRWLHRVAYHFWRIAHHLAVNGETGPGDDEPSELRAELEDDVDD